MGRMDGKIAIVTGGAQGQGAGICRAFVAEGAQVVIADVAKEAGQALADDLGADAHYADHDVSDPASWARVVEDTNERFGPVSVLANNAGILRFGDIERQAVEEVELIWRINQLGCFLGMQAVTRTMRKNGGGSDHRPSVRRVRRDGRAGRCARGRAALRQGRDHLDRRRPRQAARRLLHRPRPRRRVRGRLDHEAEGLR